MHLKISILRFRLKLLACVNFFTEPSMRYFIMDTFNPRSNKCPKTNGYTGYWQGTRSRWLRILTKFFFSLSMRRDPKTQKKNDAKIQLVWTSKLDQKNDLLHVIIKCHHFLTGKVFKTYRTTVVSKTKTIKTIGNFTRVVSHGAGKILEHFPRRFCASKKARKIKYIVAFLYLNQAEETGYAAFLSPTVPYHGC